MRRDGGQTLATIMWYMQQISIMVRAWSWPHVSYDSVSDQNFRVSESKRSNELTRTKQEHPARFSKRNEHCKEWHDFMNFIKKDSKPPASRPHL